MGMSIIQKGSQQGRSEIMLKDEKNRAGSSEYWVRQGKAGSILQGGYLELAASVDTNS